ncbi:MAG: peptidoglycan-associated lipoprotein Pal [Thermodesulfobacteriota bacterium]
MKRYFRVLPLLLLSFTLIAGCGGKKNIEDMGGSADGKSTEVIPDEVTAPATVTSEDLGGETGPAAKGPGSYAELSPGDALTKQAENNGRLYTIYFDYDRYNIKADEKANLDTNARWLKLNNGVKVRIEGHADERGETEYNLALGDKRARSVKRYLTDMGVDASKLSTISYGEEKPAVEGHDESAWSKNRRAEFMITE